MGTLEFRVHTPNLLSEIGDNNKQLAVMSSPLMILKGLLGRVAKRAIELNDEELNKLMIQMTLYSVADPESEDYDKNIVEKYLYK